MTITPETRQYYRDLFRRDLDSSIIQLLDAREAEEQKHQDLEEVLQDIREDRDAFEHALERMAEEGLKFNKLLDQTTNERDTLRAQVKLLRDFLKELKVGAVMNVAKCCGQLLAKTKPDEEEPK